MKMIPALVILSIVCCLASSCTSGNTIEQRVAAITIHDTIIVHDTIEVKDQSNIETIEYYKGQMNLLWDAVDLMEVTNSNNEAKLKEINNQIVSAREKHNKQVRENFVSDIQKIANRKP